jgi:hypothetical protein
MLKKRTAGLISIVLILCLWTGCSFIPSSDFRIDEIDGDIQCEFRIGKSAQFSKNKVFTDAVFDKEEFIELFNLRESYTANRLRFHLDECSLKIVASEQPEELEKMQASEINFKVVYDGVDERKDNVSVYEYNSKLYFFVLCMGSRSKEDEIGYYYMELPEDMQEYWLPIIEKVSKDDKENKEKEYGSFTIDRTYSHDKKYYAECVTRSTGAVYIEVYESASNLRISSFNACRSSDFWGICWEYDNYNLWIASADIGYICYSFNGEEWVRNKEAVKPDYIIGRW